MKSARQLNEAILVERHAQRGLLRWIKGANSTHTATINNFPINCTVFDKDGNAIELTLSNINEKAWKKYCSQHPDLEMGVLTNNFIPVVCDIAHWLRAGGYSKGDDDA